MKLEAERGVLAPGQDMPRTVGNHPGWGTQHGASGRLRTELLTSQFGPSTPRAVREQISAALSHQLCADLSKPSYGRDAW